jgi:hypothetical protein
VILTEFMDFIVVAKVAVVAIFPNVAGIGGSPHLLSLFLR